MTEDYLPPIERTLDLVGAGPYSMEEGIEETVRWLNNGRDCQLGAINSQVTSAKVDTHSNTVFSARRVVAADHREIASVAPVGSNDSSTFMPLPSPQRK
jgi:hypothetical protein